MNFSFSSLSSFFKQDVSRFFSLVAAKVLSNLVSLLCQRRKVKQSYREVPIFGSGEIRNRQRCSAKVEFATNGDFGRTLSPEKVRKYSGAFLAKPFNRPSMHKHKHRSGRKGFGSLLTVPEHEESVFSSYLASRRRSKVKVPLGTVLVWQQLYLQLQRPSILLS